MNYMVNLNFIYLHVTLMVGFKANVYKDNKVLLIKSINAPTIKV